MIHRARFFRILKKGFKSPIKSHLKLVGKLTRGLKDVISESKDSRQGTFSKYMPYGTPDRSPRPFPIPADPGDLCIVRGLTDNYLAHRFDLLGSGWLTVRHGLEPLGLDGYKYRMGAVIRPDRKGDWLKGRINNSNVEESARIWRLTDQDYIPIDWHLDFKSGYRWSEKTWYKKIEFGVKPGVDVKVPWELGRMQHLCQLAWAYAFSKSGAGSFLSADVYLREFRNQVLDFIASNPPRYGVNWRCTMDVAIRVANWVIAYDLFRAFGGEFDSSFESLFIRSVYEHGRHCINNLERTDGLRTNHYLSDVAGLLFASSFLPLTKETIEWLSFAISEICHEMNIQFYPEGSNFEASTSYHRLSTEIILLSAIRCLSLSSEKRTTVSRILKADNDIRSDRTPFFPRWFWERLEKALEFTMHCLKPSGDVAQIGDNDSGRFLKLWPKYKVLTCREAVLLYSNLDGYPKTDDPYFDECVLEHGHLLGVGSILFDREDFSRFCGKTPENELVRGLLRNFVAPSYHKDRFRPFPAAAAVRKGSGFFGERLRRAREEFGEPIVSSFDAARMKSHLRSGLEVFAYERFGIYVYRSPRLYLVVRCGSIGQNGFGGHAHNDQLAIELAIDRRDVVRDPGTYLYTPVPEIRNRFRSTSVHFTPQCVGKEQNPFLTGPESLFRMPNVAKAVCLYFGMDGFEGRHFGFGRTVTRLVEVGCDKIIVYDFGGTVRTVPADLYSNGYGKLFR